MKNFLIGILLLSAVNVFATSSNDAIDIKNYRSITIEKNISLKEIQAYKKDGKDMGIKVIENPKFTCLTVGYKKENFFEKGTLYGTKNKDGNIEVGKTGDYVVYYFEKYFKDGHFCVEITYEKGDEKYGDKTVASLH